MYIPEKTEAWYAARATRITGTKAGAILGLNPYKSADEQMKEMLEAYAGQPPEFIGNQATEWGAACEPFAILCYEFEYRERVQDVGLAVHPCGWLAATSDGIAQRRGRLLEVKSPFGAKKSGKFKTLKEQPYYYAQIQIELYCYDYPTCDFYQWSPTTDKTTPVPRDDRWLSEKLPILEVFYNEYINNRDEYRAKRLSAEGV